MTPSRRDFLKTSTVAAAGVVAASVGAPHKAYALPDNPLTAAAMPTRWTWMWSGCP